MRGRSAERIWLNILPPGAADDFDAVAVASGIRPLGRAWVEVNDERARQLLTALLHMDLAYKSPVMPQHTAEWLASQFLNSFGQHGCRFATNTEDMPDGPSFGWTPGTDLTFDAGLIVIGEAGAGLYWVADED